jgi:hypothetical protein
VAIETILDNEYASLTYHSDKKIVYHVFRKPISGEPFRQVLNEGAKLIQKHGANKWLSDDRENSVLPPEDFDWVNADWLPRVVNAGWKYWALVIPNEMMARLNMTDFVNSFYQRGLRIMVFTKPEEAMEWLQRQ